MEYRLVRIYEKADDGNYRLRIEVCNETHRKSLPPFLRKISLDKLNDNNVEKPIISLINQSGADEQSPFIISNQEYLRLPSVLNVLESLGWSYIQASRHGSLKKGKIYFNPLSEVSTRPTGKIISAELYIDEVKSWHRNIRVMFRYEYTVSAFYPFANILDYVRNDGSICSRDIDLEMTYLEMLHPYYDGNTGRLSLNPQDCSEFLSEIISKGWTLYIPKSNASYARAFSHTTASGIKWFSTSEVSDEDISNQLLDNFLKSRNYIESDGTVSLFNTKEVIHSDEKSLATLSGATQDILSLYNSDEPTQSDLLKKIENRVRVRLRSYQIDGVKWLHQKREIGAGCLLADEMGLGKTLQVIAHLACLDEVGDHLIIAPTSLLFNWKNEVERFAPQLLSQLTFVSYDILRIHLEEYLEQAYDTIVIDEAQIIKNRDTKKYKAIAQLHCKHKIILTGTPIENSIEDIWSLLLMLNPDMRTMHDNIRKLNIQSETERTVELTAKLLKPFILRRTKSEHLPDLPERTEETVYIELSCKERAIYEKVNISIVTALRTGLSGRVTSIVLEGLLRLRQTCVSVNMLPSMLTGSGKFTSTKLSTALEFINGIKAEGHKVLVFSQFVSALEEMEELLSSNDIKYVTLYGSTRKRKATVEQFQEDPLITVFLISIKAGGVGLNLTAADRIILLDDWWNPAVEDQAMSRSHRIGQQNNVHVIRLVCKDTVEEKVLELQQKKKDTTDLFSKTNANLTIEEIRELIDTKLPS